MDAARTSTVELNGLVKLLLSSTGDVDLGSVADKGLGDHETNASSATSNDSGDVGDIEEVGVLQLVVFYLSCGSY